MYYAILLKVNASRSGGDVFRAPAVHVPIAHCPSELFVVALVLDKSACGLWACQAPTRPRQIHIDIDTRYTPASHYYLLYFSSHCCPLVRLLFSSSEAASPSYFHKNVLINVLCARDRLGGGGCDFSSRVFLQAHILVHILGQFHYFSTLRCLVSILFFVVLDVLFVSHRMGFWVCAREYHTTSSLSPILLRAFIVCICVCSLYR